MPTLTHRENGLDTLRGLAIILVVIFHYQVFVSHADDFGVISQIGWIGVDLFFVLSGYLISNQVFNAIKNKDFSLQVFFIKRLFKTLPNYYFVLLLYFAIPGFAEKAIVIPLWKYLLFIQNFNLPVSGFSQSWSLCVEEQFYLVFPFLALYLCRKNRILFIAILFGAMVAGVFLREALWQHLSITGNLKHYTTVIYYPTYCRLDGFICGILVAYIQNYYPKLWQQLVQHGNKLLIFGLILLSCFTRLADQFNSQFTATLGYLGIALSFAIITLSALSNNSLLVKYKISFLSKIAQWSYAIYLIQKPISVLSAKYFTHLGLNNNSYPIILLNFILQITVGYLLYLFIERRFMLVRDKFLKK